jgi:NADPH:quinone reductase-like Zn-dependent oxidoreductase
MLTFEQAAAMPLAANTALVCLRAGNAHAGQDILINGASGGVGTFAVQLAKAMGLRVTAVCSTRNVDLVRSLGADTVIDYRRRDFSHCGNMFDVVLDLVGNRTLRDLLRVVNSTGTLVLSGGGVSGQGTPCRAPGHAPAWAAGGAPAPPAGPDPDGHAESGQP